MNEMLNVFQSDCIVSNHDLTDTYNFNLFENAYKFYLLNIFRNNGYVEKIKLFIQV